MDAMKTKQLEKGLLQLMEEGVAQLFSYELGKRKVRDGLVVGGLRRTLVGNDLVHPLLGDDDTRRQRAVAL